MKKALLIPTLLSLAGLALAGVCQAADTIRINGSGSGLDLMRPLIAAYLNANKDVRIDMEKPLGSSGAVKALLAGALDLVVSSKPLKPEESARGARMMEYGSTPLAIVTEPDVPIADVTTRELENIFAGRTTAWSNGTPIRPVLRPEEDIDTRILRELSAGMNQAMSDAKSRPGQMTAVTDPEAYLAVARTPGSIGATGLVSVVVEKLPLKVLSLNGVAPAPAALAARTYPLAKQLNFVTAPGTPTAARKFLKFVYSPHGRAIAEKAGVLVTAGPDQGR